MRSTSTSRQLRPAERISPFSGSSVARSSSSARSASTKRSSPAASAAMPLRGRLDLEAVQEAAPALGQRDRDAQLLGDRQAEVLHGLQDVRQVERAHRVEAERRRPRRSSARRAARAAPRAARTSRRPPGTCSGASRLAVEAAARLRRHEAPEQRAPAALAEGPLEGGGGLVLPARGERLGEPAGLVDVDRPLQLGRVEVEEEQRQRPAVERGRVRHRPERVRHRPAQRLLALVRVAQAREGDVERLVAGALAHVRPRSRRRSPRGRCGRSPA